MTDANIEHSGAPPESLLIAQIPRISIQAFCETQEVAEVILNASTDRRMIKAHVKVHMGGVVAAIEAFRAAPTPNLIVVESAADRMQLIANLDMLAEYCDPGTKVVVIGHENDIALYRALTARGVSDYLVTPVDVLPFIQHVSHLYNGPEAETLGRVIAVVGAKGGVGASNVSHNLAWSLSRVLKYQTVIADLDLAFGTAGLDFNQDPPQGIAEAVYSPERVDSTLVDRLLSKCSDTLSLLAAPATVDKAYDLPENAFDPVLDVLRATTPCTVLDLPHAWTSWARHILIGADEVVIVATPDLANLRNAKTLFDAVRVARPNDRPPKLVLNSVGVPKRPEIAAAEFAKAIEVSPVAVIPFEPKLFGTAANNGQMLAEIEPGSKIVESFDNLARLVMGRTDLQKSKKSLLGPLLERFAGKKAS
ncbi:AAA family ATPase [Methylocystis heyeri]|uniref:CtpF protein n=1 Tax=Methylocystis heyeri TaxID=391905 RepID=A0A6B8KCM2_9HYPH|nr:CtpF protein [Methylocystis heyeri]QGM46174.1 CtpF protein [Methylocystis heyeri]